MKLLAIALLAGILAAAQPVLTITGPATVTAGTSASVVVSLSGSAGLSVTGVQWSHSLPNGVNLGTPVVSSSALALGKGVYCGQSTCLVVGLSATNAISNTPFADGAVATIPLVFPPNASLGATSLQLSGTLAASTTGAAIPIAPGAAYSITVLPGHCDANGDGAVNGADVGLVITALIGRGSCPLSGGCSLQSLIAVLIAASGGSCTL